MIRPEDVRPSTPLGDLVLGELARLVGVAVAVDIDPPHRPLPGCACDLCVAEEPEAPAVEPAVAMLRARRRHRPTVALDVVARRGFRRDARAEGGAL